MNSAVQRYKLLNFKIKILIWLVIFISSLYILPAIVVYIAGAFLSYFLIKDKVWKYILVTIFSVGIFLSAIILIPIDDSPEQVPDYIKKEDEGIQLDQKDIAMDSPVVTDSLSTPTDIESYNVTRVVDGDTIDVSIDGNIERLRLIGINTPETVDPRKPVECFGVEASNKAKEVLAGKKVILESDPSQGEFDKYDRLLRYVFLEDGTNFNLLMIKEGYAYEYTYDIPYKYQVEFKQAQKEAELAKAGLWGSKCDNPDTAIITPITTQNTSSTPCTIKGNISSTKEKIYHVIGCGSYAKTQIDETKGEKWFCTEQEALDAGWRKALNCN